MLRLIRVRLALSYAGIALLVTLSLGGVLLLRLHAYYAGMEQDYLNSNAKAISGMAAPILMKNYPKDVQEAQVSNLAFLSQTRVRILDPQKNVLADSGPWPAAKIGLGVVRAAKVQVRVNGSSSAPAASVIVLQKQADPNGPGTVELMGRFPGGEIGKDNSSTAYPGVGIFGGQTVSRPAGQPTVDSSGKPSLNAYPGAAPVGEQPDVLFFNSAVPVSSGVYGLYLSKQAVLDGARSSQVVQAPIIDASGKPLGYVELSESPAYGTEIVNSVASGLAVAGGLAILLAIGVGWLTSRILTAPLSNLTQATQQMSSGDLSVRVIEAGRKDEFGALGKSFNQMAGRIEETIQTLRRFLSDAAHELQTPLTALRTNLELARGEQNNPATDQYLTHALDQIERLQRMIKDLLSLSRLESAATQEMHQRIDFCDLVRQVSEPFAARAEQAGQALDLEVPDSKVLVMGSPEKLCSALENLLDNALKFTAPGGSVVIHLQVAEEEVCLTVSDTGIGVPPDEIEMLFNRFHRGRNAASYPGSGLGLAIVRAVAQAHNGRVQVANNPQGGASFTLCLPQIGTDPSEDLSPSDGA